VKVRGTEKTVCVPLFATAFQSTAGELSKALEEALAVLSQRGWIDPKKEFCLRLCIEEALVNAMKHGNRGESGRKIRLVIEEEGDMCHIFVYDECGIFDPRKVTTPPPEQMGGRGVCLMKHYMESVSYDHSLHRLEMSMRRKPCCAGGE
jgi:serine/threonine-protein kinase RsbW